MSKRKKWPAAEELRIVLTGMRPNVEVSELCRREGINPTQYYGWKKQLLSSATKVFDAADGRSSASEEKKQAAPGGGGKGDAAEPALGDGRDAGDDRRHDLFRSELHGRVFALRGAL